MKKLLAALLIILSMISLFAFVSCDTAEEVNNESGDTLGGLWADAKYTSDTTIGEGAKTVTVAIVAEGKTVTLTVKTDEDNLGDALYDLGIINDASFFDVCNGILASWAQDQAYWAFKQNGKMLNYGVGDAKINGGESFSIEYTK